MCEIIQKIFDYMYKYHVIISIDFLPEGYGQVLRLKIQKGSSVFFRRFYYVPKGKDTLKSFMEYNTDFELQVENMIKKLEEAG